MKRNPYHDRMVCIQCREYVTKSVTALCWSCRPVPSIQIIGDICRIGSGFDLPCEKAIVLAHSILDALTPSYKKEQ
jgi:hypothetical protein